MPFQGKKPPSGLNAEKNKKSAEMLLHEGHINPLVQNLLKDIFPLKKLTQDRLTSDISCETEDIYILKNLLTYLVPSKQAEKTAFSLLESYGNLSNLFLTPVNILKQNPLITDKIIDLFQLCYVISQKMVLQPTFEKTVLASWQSLSDYARLTMGNLQHEEFHVWFLNKSYHLLGKECLSRGTINRTSIYPRELVKATLDFGASMVILLHNHPSGDTSPSHEDIRITEYIVHILKSVEIEVLDHLIVTPQEVVSFRNLGLL